MPGESKGTRVIALVGPAGAGKTSLAEALLYASGTTDRQGSVANGSSIGDSTAEARSRGGSTEINLYQFNYLGDKYAIVDAPGSIGFAADGARGAATRQDETVARRITRDDLRGWLTAQLSRA